MPRDRIESQSSFARFYGATESKKEKGLARRSFGEGGFTLLELLVVMGITVVLTTIVLGYSRQSSSQLALASTESKMLSLINRAKFLSIETYFGGGESGDPNKRICAYGVKVDPSAKKLFIFRDLSNTGKCGPNDSNNAYDTGEELSSGELNEVKLDDNLLLFGARDLDEVIFIPPRPDTKINKSDTPSASIMVKPKNGTGGFKITVTNAGQVKAEGAQ
ncbi:MAG: type II secretion system protein [Candidatus Colwellbacteria bacterium]|nr:type II secretion system protein [Candidatus Colwellbacteria bacterium]